jgi:valyl-tRNA synthetase
MSSICVNLSTTELFYLSGEGKNMEKLSKTYDFHSTEQRIYAWWENSGYFKPDNDPSKPGFDPMKKPFVISIPPPNVTGELHLGHAMFVSMEDLMIRYHRMKGIPTLWVPGTDHAGIATQLQVERALAKEGLTREQIGRDEFLRRTWEWKAKYGGIITSQVRRLGASCDWERERFTLDEGLSRAVREAFVRLYEKGLIYRGPRLINWSPGLKTAVSDLEVEYSEEPGTLYYFKYLFTDQDQKSGNASFIPVATTRPETILGDTAVAVHPDDPRYQKYVGKEVLVPILGRRIPVIADEYVDRDFATGALKITPGHDPNDYAIGQHHGLQIISILDESAHLNENGGPYQGQDRFEARKNLWEDMLKAGLVIKEEPYTINVPRSQRGGEIVEPMISTQWFVRIKPLAEAGLQAVQEGRIHIVPERFTKVYYNWLENIEDWCISRQLWWGHRIPVWYCADCNQVIVALKDPVKCTVCGGSHLEQDPDVLDTWFSSGLWPFSTLGWPDETPDYKYFYPTTVLETGYDILFFWVARMIMDGLEFTCQVPFHVVYLHGLIRDENGRKMSKSYGNVIDPLIVMDELGTDALRFTLLVGSTPGNDMNLSLKKVEANRNFANKVWNVTRFVLTAIDEQPVEERKESLQKESPISSKKDGMDWTLADRWIRARVAALTRDAERLFQNYQYGEAGRQIYDFFWGEFADWYIEVAKLQLAEGADRAASTSENLVFILDVCLRLLHPFTPFVTEELWGHLKRAAKDRFAPVSGGEWEQALILARWPEPIPAEAWEETAVTDFSLVMELVRSIRNLRAEKHVKPGRRIPAILSAGQAAETLRSQAKTLAFLAYLDENKLQIFDSLAEKPQRSTILVVGTVEVYLPQAGLVDVQEERIRLNKELSVSQAQVERLEKLLDSSFAEKAPEPVVQKERDKLATFIETVQKLKAQIDNL